MKVLVTGATGLVGSRLLERLEGAGHSCVALSRTPGRAAATLSKTTRVYPWRPPAQPPAEAFEGVDAVIHLAGEPVVGRWTEAKRQSIRGSRVEGTRLLVESLASLEQRPRILISASAIGFYGDRGDAPLAEDADAGDDFLASVCVGWEEAARGAEALGMRVLCLRIGLVLDPAGGALAAMLPSFRMGLGGRLGSGRQWWSWIHLEDLLSLCMRSLTDEDLRGPVNACAPGAVRQAEFARELAHALGRWALLPAPARALELILGGFATELLASRRVTPAAASLAGFDFRYPSLPGALRNLLQAPGARNARTSG
jgi:uncharacterized protein (TIGR01777 family)